MTIQRSPHDKVNPYVMLNKGLLQDPDLSWAAKGLLSYLISLPNDWRVQVSHLSKIYGGKGGGEKAIYALLKELIEAGYCEKVQLKNESGYHSGVDYHITEFKKCLGHSPQGDAAQGVLLEGVLLEVGTTNKEVLQKNKTTTTNEQSSSFLTSEEKKQEPSRNSSFEEKIKSFFAKIIQEHKLPWKIRDCIIYSLSNQYPKEYLSDQIDYMWNQQKKSIKDSRNMNKKNPKKNIDDPETYLKMSCQMNWASSEHSK